MTALTAKPNANRTHHFHGDGLRRTVGTCEAKAKLSQLLTEVAAGAEVVITRNGQAIAKLVAVETLPVADSAAIERTRKLARRCKTGPLDIRALIEEDRR